MVFFKTRTFFILRDNYRHADDANAETDSSVHVKFKNINMKNPLTMEITDSMIKPFADVCIGDMAVSVDFHDEEEGLIVWKGSLSELKKSSYKMLVDEYPDNLLPDEYDWVVTVVPMYGAALFNYNNDPCGVVVLAADAARKENQLKTANICRAILTEEILKKL